jgi:hypothetical protein
MMLRLLLRHHLFLIHHLLLQQPQEPLQFLLELLKKYQDL